ncbi:BLUF domain-containing protein [Mucilaginibacter sp. UYCu711]|uniref:BLUF domain-containing protein n=1 Tax=Mucilaginibacter sp. UYCu711 TaxID=3156339 RepID=UPI003D1A18CC
MLYYLIYVSKATAPMSATDLLSLLDSSRTWNEAHELTGMLLYIQGEPVGEKAGRFIQVLEGSEPKVRQIFDLISTDVRHNLVSILNEGPLKSRNFESWRIGFEAITTVDLSKHPGYVDLNNAFLEAFDRKKFNFALNFLKTFYDLRSKIC